MAIRSHAGGMATTTKGRPRSARGARAPRRSAAEWAAEVAAWKGSGETTTEYAQSRGISAATLAWWSSRGGGGTQSGSTQSVPIGERQGGAVAFLPVVVRPGAPKSSMAPEIHAQIELVGGRRVHVTGPLTLEHFAQLLDVLEGRASC